MSNLNKKVFVAIVIVALLIVSIFWGDRIFSRGGQSASANLAMMNYDSDTALIDEYNAVSASVSKVQLDKNTYKTGDKIVGEFIVKNNSIAVSSNLYYSLALGADYQPNTLAGIFYGETSPVSIGSLAPHEERLVKFEYSIPKGVGGNKMAVQVGLLGTSGASLGWKDSNFIDISGGVPQLKIDGTGIVVKRDGQDVVIPSDTGPMIYQDKETNLAKAGIFLKNITSLPVDVYPIVIVSDINKDNKIVYQGGFEKFSVAKGSELSKLFDLPTLDYTPGVYMAKISLQDKDGVGRAPDLYFRYIVGGDILDVKDLVANSVHVQKGDYIDLSLIYSASPVDFLESEKAGEAGRSVEISNQVNKVKIKLVNEKGEVVTDSEQEVTFVSGEDRSDIAVLAEANAKSLKAEINVYDSKGVLLDSYAKDIQIITAEQSEFDYWMNWLWPVLFVVFAILFLVFVIKRRDSEYSTVKIVFAVICLAALILIGFKIANSYSVTNVTSTSNAACNYIKGASFVLNTPSEGVEIGAGSSFQVTGSLSYTQCNNTPARSTVKITNRTPGTVITSQGTDNKQCGRERLCPAGTGHYTPRGDQFSVGPFVAPTAIGTHWLDLETTVTNGICSIKITGIHSYRVVAPTASNSGTNYSSTVVTPAPTVNLCGAAAGTKAKGYGGLTASSANLCASGSSYVSRSFGINYRSNKWFWQCTQSGASSNCDATCSAGSYYCRSSNSCATSCADWCENIAGNQSTFTSANGTPIQYASIRDEDGNCADPVASIQQFNIDPRFADVVSRKCSSYWTTSVSAPGRLRCSMINSDGNVAVNDQNPAGLATSTGYLIPLGISTLSCQIQIQDEEGNWVGIKAPVTSRVSCELPRNTVEQ